MFPRTLRNNYVYTRHPTNVTATSGMLTRLPAKLSKKQNVCSGRPPIGGLNGLRSEQVKTSGLLRNHTPLSDTKTDMIFEVLMCKTMGNQAVGYTNLKKIKSEPAYCTCRLITHVQILMNTMYRYRIHTW